MYHNLKKIHKNGKIKRIRNYPNNDDIITTTCECCKEKKTGYENEWMLHFENEFRGQIEYYFICPDCVKGLYAIEELIHLISRIKKESDDEKLYRLIFG